MNRMSPARTFAAVLVAALALPAIAQDALSLVPENAATVGMVKLSEIRSSPLSSLLLQHTDRMSADGDAAKFLADAGLSPAKDIDVLVVATSPRSTIGSEADVLVIAEGRFDVARLTKALVERGAVSKGGYLTLPEPKSDDAGSGAVAFPTASLALAGNERAVAAALAARTSGGTGFRSRSALASELGRIDRSATAWALVDVARASRLGKASGMTSSRGNSGEALQAALRSVSTVAMWATDRGDALGLGAVGVSPDAETLQLLEDTIRGGLSAMRLAVREKSPELVSVLRRFDVSRKRDAVHIEGSIPASALRDMMAKKHASRD